MIIKRYRKITFTLNTSEYASSYFMHLLNVLFSRKKLLKFKLALILFIIKKITNEILTDVINSWTT